MELNEMGLANINERLEALDVEVRESQDLAFIEKATEEKRALVERRQELEALEQRKATAEALNNGELEAEKVLERGNIKMEEIKRITPEMPEYRDAFMAVLTGKATVEQRGIFADNTSFGDGASLPTGLDKEIWDTIYTNHPILADIDAVDFGVAIKVTQATPAGVSGKKDSATVSEMTITFKDVTLAGKDYLATVKLSYAEAKMSAGAMEKYIAKAVVDQVGEAMAKDVFARILTDCAANSVTKGDKTYFEAIHDALGKAKTANNPVIYAPSALYYNILGEVDTNGQPIVRDGVVLGAVLKKDNAATKITVVEPKDFVLDRISSVTVKVADKVEEGCLVYGAYARAEGCMRKTNSGAFIA